MGDEIRHYYIYICSINSKRAIIRHKKIVSHTYINTHFCNIIIGKEKTSNKKVFIT
jgi:hypothetical protein